MLSHRRVIHGLFFGFATLSVAVYAAIFWRMPMMGEDFAFPQRFVNAGWGERIAWIAHKIPSHTADWNARFGEQLAIAWLSLPEWLFWLVALSAFVALNALIAMVYSGRRDWPLKLALSVGLMFALWPGLEVFFWKTANAGYLQPVVLCLVCIVAYRSEATIQTWITRPTAIVALCFAGLCAGYSFENVPLALAVYMLLAWVLMQQRRQAWLALLPVGAVLLGWAALMAMPSTSHRRAYYAKLFGAEHPDLAYYIHRAGEVTGTFFETGATLFAVSLLALAWLVYLSRGQGNGYDIRAWLTIVPAVLVVGSMLAAPYTEPRAFSLAWALMFAVVVEAAYQACRRWHWAGVLCVLALLVSAGFAMKTLVIYEDVSDTLQAREMRIIEHLGTTACLDGIPIEQQHFDYSYRYFNNRDNWYLSALPQVSGYYGCKLVPKGAQ